MANMTFGVNIIPKSNAEVTLGNSDNPWEIVSPELTGTPTAPTPASGDDSTKIATTAFVQDAISGAAGTGDVTGPNSSTDGDIVLFDGTTGKVIKDSGVSLSDKADDDAVVHKARNESITGAKYFNGAVKLNNDVDVKNSNSEPGINYTYTQENLPSGSITLPMSDTPAEGELIKPGRFKFTQYSAGEGLQTDVADAFYLPVTEENLLENAEYNIITTKNLSDITGFVHTTGDENIAGAKWFTNNSIKVGRSSGSRYHYVMFEHDSDSHNGYIRVDSGSSTNQTINQFRFAEYSPNSTADSGNTGKMEYYTLPAPAKGLTADTGYSIITTKNCSDIVGADVTGVVHTSGDENINGDKTFNDGVNLQPASRYKNITYKQSGTSATTAILCYDSGNATNVTSGSWQFFQYSPKATADGNTTGYYERYSLPTVATGLAANATYTIYTTKNINDMTGCTSSAAGTHGFVPAPAKNSGKTKFLGDDGSWHAIAESYNTLGVSSEFIIGNNTLSLGTSGATAGSYGMSSATTGSDGTTVNIPYLTVDEKGRVTAISNKVLTCKNTTYSTFVKSGSTAAAGLVPKPSTTAGTTKFLCEDATWSVPPDTTYSAATSSNLGLIKIGYSSSGNNFAVKLSSNKAYVTVPGFTASGSDTPAPGLVPATSTTAGSVKFLCEDAIWRAPININGTDRRLQIRTGTITAAPHNAWSDAQSFSNSGFSNACVAVQCRPSSSFGAAVSVAVDITSKTKFKVYQFNTQNAAVTLSYVAFGY